jgi:hypothetical protein
MTKIYKNEWLKEYNYLKKIGLSEEEIEGVIDFFDYEIIEESIVIKFFIKN